MCLLCKWDFIAAIDVLIRKRHFLEGGDKDSRASKEKAKVHFLDCLRKAVAHVKTTVKKHLEEEERKLEMQFQAEQARQDRLLSKEQGIASTKRLAAFGSQLMPSSDSAHRLQAASEGQRGSSTVWKRDRLVSSMMMEPEVIQIVEQYRDLFAEIFDCYATASGGFGIEIDADGRAVDFQILLQFCLDFNIIPRIASRHEVLRAFSATLCLDKDPQAGLGIGSSDPELDAFGEDEEALTPTLGKRRRPGGNGSQTQRERGALTSPEKKQELGSPRTPRKNAASKGGPGQSKAGGEGDLASPRTARKRQEQKQSSRRGSITEAGRSAREGPNSGAGGGKSCLPPPPPPVDMRFGPAAFVEAICRIGFGYFIIYGNPVQQATTSRAKMAWLIAFLHSVYISLQKSHTRHVEGRPNTAPKLTTSAEDEAATEEAVQGAFFPGLFPGGGGGGRRYPVGALPTPPGSAGSDSKDTPTPRNSSKESKRSSTMAMRLDSQDRKESGRRGSAESMRRGSAEPKRGAVKKNSVKKEVTGAEGSAQKEAVPASPALEFPPDAAAEATLPAEDPPAPGAGSVELLPTPPSTASCGVSRRLARVLARIGPGAFSEPMPVPLQRPRAPEPCIEALPFLQEAALAHGAAPKGSPGHRSSEVRSQQLANRTSSKQDVQPSRFQPRSTVTAVMPGKDAQQGMADASAGKRKHATIQHAITVMPEQMGSAPEDKAGKQRGSNSAPVSGSKAAAGSAAQGSTQKSTGGGSGQGSPEPKAEGSREEALFSKPDPPVVQEDVLRFDQILFAKLFLNAGGRDNAPKESARTSAPGSRRHSNSSTTAEDKRRVASPRPDSAPWPESIGGDPAPGVGRILSRPLSRPPRGEDEEQFVGDLNTTAGRLERSDLTPPPLSSFAAHLAEKLETMITHSQEQPRR